MNANFQIVDQLSKFNVCNQDNQQIEQIYNERKELMNIMSYVEFSKPCNVIKNFLNRTKMF